MIIPLGFEFNSRRLDIIEDFEEDLEIFYKRASTLILSMLICKDFENVCIVTLTLILSIVIYNLLNSFMFRNLIRRFGLLKQTRKDFYECGFRPVTQKPICLPIPFLLICVFFLLYDIELIYLFPLVSSEEYIGLYETLLLLFFFLILFVGLMFDFTRHALY